MANLNDLLVEIYEIHSILSGFSEISEQFSLAVTSSRNSQQLNNNLGSRSTHQNRNPTSQVSDSANSSHSSSFYKSLQKRFPIFKFSGPQESQCVVCYGKFQTGQNVKILSCLHKFHVSCIDPWLAKEHRCPVCRYDLTKIVDIREL